MNKVSMPALLIGLAGMLSGVAVRADNAHFIRANGAINDDGAYVATFKEAGLGANQNIDYLLTAGPVEFTYQCYTKSNNRPQGSPNSVFLSTLTTGGSFNSGKNGSITASLILTPEPTDGCQGAGLKLCLDYVSYQNVLLQDVTNAISIGLPSLNRNFVVNGRPTNC